MNARLFSITCVTNRRFSPSVHSLLFPPIYRITVTCNTLCYVLHESRKTRRDVVTENVHVKRFFLTTTSLSGKYNIGINGSIFFLSSQQEIYIRVLFLNQELVYRVLHFQTISIRFFFIPVNIIILIVFFLAPENTRKSHVEIFTDKNITKVCFYLYFYLYKAM